MRSSAVCEASNDCPIEGSATLATDRLRLATAATTMRDSRTILAFAGAPPPIAAAPVAACRLLAVT